MCCRDNLLPVSGKLRDCLLRHQVLGIRRLDRTLCLQQIPLYIHQDMGAFGRYALCWKQFRCFRKRALYQEDYLPNGGLGGKDGRWKNWSQQYMCVKCAYCYNVKTIVFGIGIPIIKMRGSGDRLILVIGFTNWLDGFFVLVRIPDCGNVLVLVYLVQMMMIFEDSGTCYTNISLAGYFSFSGDLYQTEFSYVRGCFCNYIWKY